MSAMCSAAYHPLPAVVLYKDGTDRPGSHHSHQQPHTIIISSLSRIYTLNISLHHQLALQMLAVILLAAGLAPTALGVLMPKFNVSDPEFSFDIPNTSVEEGFRIPEGIPNGVYTVSISSDGVAHYQRHGLPTDIY
jgi:hypothetical protein